MLVASAPLSGCLGSGAGTENSERIPEPKRERGGDERIERSVETTLEAARREHGGFLEQADERDAICHHEARDAVADHLESELDAPLEAVSPKLLFSSGQFQLEVWAVTTVTGDDDVVSTPEVEFSDLVAATPESVSMTVELDDEQYTCQTGVMVEQTVEREGA
ncbi:hypothetical protein [Halopiger goleimassiliensis]|uniref:hypothetical protein n=1 Tax=Halopiger goleimassiliensis TaxID=1293048 RepID=UPI0006775CCE|nr:hypothetical protein [Halopiger goleimassiliensis]